MCVTRPMTPNTSSTIPFSTSLVTLSWHKASHRIHKGGSHTMAHVHFPPSFPPAYSFSVHMYPCSSRSPSTSLMFYKLCLLLLNDYYAHSQLPAPPRSVRCSFRSRDGCRCCCSSSHQQHPSAVSPFRGVRECALLLLLRSSSSSATFRSSGFTCSTVCVCSVAGGAPPEILLHSPLDGGGDRRVWGRHSYGHFYMVEIGSHLLHLVGQGRSRRFYD